MRSLVKRWVGALAVFACWGAAGDLLRAQNADLPNVYLSVSVDAKQKMQLLDGFVAQKNWPEAVDLLQSLAEKQGDRLAPTTVESPNLFINLRAYCNARLAALPPEALAVYRSRVDGQAEALWRQWEHVRDVRALEKIAEEFFASTVADRAVDRLGDRAFAEGRLADAAGWWTRLLSPDWSQHRPAAAPQLQFHHPSPRTDEARVAAKCILAKILGGDLAGGKRMLATLRVKHPSAKGRLGASDGAYVELLTSLLASNELAPPAANGDSLTFGGDERRNKMAAARPDVGGLQFLWDFDADGGANEREESPVNDLRLPHYPVVVGDAVYAAAESAIWKFDLKSGKATRWLELGVGRNGSEVQRSRYTVTIKGRRLFVTAHDTRANFGGRTRGFGPRRDWHSVNSTLICFDLPTQKELWRANPSDFGADRGAVFEGSPIGVGDDLCVAVTRYDAMSETSILRMDAATRRLVWKSVVCESMTEGTFAEPPMYNLLSLGDSTIYYCTNLGAVAAVRADDGRLKWVATYARRAPPTTAPADPSVPDLNPCVVHQGRVFALPRDGRRLLCFDAETGEKRWESPAALSFTHVLGAHDGVVVATGSRACGFDVATGKLRWMRPLNGSPGFGRGMLAGGDVYWPTRTDVHVYRAVTGELARPPIELFTRLGHRPGNLLVAGDYLLVAQSHRLLAFCSFNKLIERHRREITADPKAAEPRFKLGEALLQRGEFEQAAEVFAEAADLAGPLRVVGGRRLADEARDRRFLALLALAEKQPRGQAAEGFRAAFEAARTAPQRVEALTGEYPLADEKRQVAVCQAVLDSKELRSVSLPLKDGSPEAAGQWAVKNLRTLIERRGRPVYAEQEAEFARLLGEAGESPAKLRELGERFPLAFTAASLLQARAETALKDGDLAGAGQLSKQWLAAAEANDDQEAVRAAIRHLIQCEQSIGRSEAAYLWAANLSRRGNAEWPARPAVHRSEFRVQPAGEPLSVRITPAGVHAPRAGFDLAAKSRGDATELQWAPDAGSADRVSLSVPGRISWAGRISGGLAVTAGHEILFFSAKDAKKAVWRKAVADAPRFRGSLGRSPAVTASAGRFLAAGDLVVVAQDASVVALDGATGDERWRSPFPASSEYPPRLSLNDATLLVSTDAGATALDPMTGRTIFTTMGAVVSAAASGESLVLADRSGLQARDQRTGAVRWKKTLPSPTFREPLLVSSGEAVFVVEDGSQVAALAKSDGAVRWRSRLASGPAVNLVAAAGGGVVCVSAGGTLECWDARTGKRRWQRRLEAGAAGDPEYALSVSSDTVLAARLADDKRFEFKASGGEPVGP